VKNDERLSGWPLILTWLGMFIICWGAIYLLWRLIVKPWIGP
jgi:hypothetical protein